jgi:hypothetical protein
MLSEKDGCRVLKAAFEEAGFAIAESVPFDREGVSFTADGWDAEARVGYEYMTREDGDHEDLDPEVLTRLGEWANAGELFFFVIDETDVLDEGELREAAEAFLAEVARRRGSSGE